MLNIDYSLEYLNRLQHNAKVLFVVGGNESIELRREEEQFADIHQVRLPDTYHSITQKVNYPSSAFDETH